MRENKDIKKY